VTSAIYLQLQKAKYVDRIKKQLGNTLDTTSLGLGYRKEGKVRDTYKDKEVVVLVTTDRVSAFDRVISTIPYKGSANPFNKIFANYAK